jgi:transcriptional regulator with GAF, ATPase, and Fis domain
LPLLPEEGREPARQFLASITPDHPVATVEHQVLAPNGEIRWQQWTDRGFFDEQGRIIEYQAVGRDITERKRAEEALRRAFEEITQLKEQLQAENIYLREELEPEIKFEKVTGQSPQLKYVLYKVEQVAPTDATVLILGETGTGKEILARAIHERSRRNNRPMIKVDCATLPANLIESELFGHERGAFTGALQKQIGRFELADGGTIFLDEIGELPLELQPKLLRVLQEGEFERLGSSRSQKVEVRVIAATNRNLKEEVRHGRFREDLFYRLDVYTITLPPLRERQQDIPLLVQVFVNEFCAKLGKKIDHIPQRMLHALQQYAWPGNVRELRNVIERAVIICSGTTLRVEIPKIGTLKIHDGRKLEDVERDHILKTLEDTNWRIAGDRGAAVRLGLHPNTLRSRMHRLGIKNHKS